MSSHTMGDSFTCSKPLDQVLKCINQVHSHNSDPFKNYLGHVDIQRIRIRKLDSTTPAQYEEHQGPPEPLTESAADLWFSASSNADSRFLEVTLIALNTDRRRHVPGQRDLLRTLFQQCDIPAAALASLLDNRIQFAEFPTQDETSGTFSTAFHLSCRQWSLTWSSNSAGTLTKSILMWFHGSWAQNVGKWASQHLSQLREFVDQPPLVGLVGCLLALTHVTEDLSKLDAAALDRERKLRAGLNVGPAVAVLDYGRLSAETSWSSSQAVRDRNRLQAVLALLKTVASQRQCEGKIIAAANKPLSQSWQLTGLLVTHLSQASEALTAQAVKLIEENSMHLSALFNLIAQRDQTASMEIAQASKDLAVQARSEQNISNEIAEATRQLAIESKRDSTSMMTIAAVTMIFLPGTFLASCFAMPLFDWSAPTSRVVNPRIWVYWTITVILTVLTVMGWAFWMRQKSLLEIAVPKISHDSKSNTCEAEKSGSDHGSLFVKRGNQLRSRSIEAPFGSERPRSIYLDVEKRPTSSEFGPGPSEPVDPSFLPSSSFGLSARDSTIATDPIPIYATNVFPPARFMARSGELEEVESRHPFLQTASPLEIYGPQVARSRFGPTFSNPVSEHPSSSTFTSHPSYLDIATPTTNSLSPFQPRVFGTGNFSTFGPAFGPGPLFGTPQLPGSLFGPSNQGRLVTASEWPPAASRADEPFFGPWREVFQSITFLQPYQNSSFEELRLNDYAAGRRYGDGEK